MPTAADPVDADPDADAFPRPFVREDLATRSMHFSDAAIQSRMQLLHPDALALEYTRLMMGFLLFAPAPKRLAMIGLGGGSVAKFIHRHLPQSTLTVVEINPHVIALRERFEVPPDGPRFSVVCDDGAHWAATTSERVDVLLVDAFDAERMPEALVTQRFFDDCTDLLRPGGLLVVNLHAQQPHAPVYIDRLGAAIGTPALRVDDHDGTNAVVFARRNRPLRPARGTPPFESALHGAYARIAHVYGHAHGHETPER